MDSWSLWPKIPVTFPCKLQAAGQPGSKSSKSVSCVALELINLLVDLFLVPIHVAFVLSALPQTGPLIVLCFHQPHGQLWFHILFVIPRYSFTVWPKFNWQHRMLCCKYCNTFIILKFWGHVKADSKVLQ